MLRSYGADRSISYLCVLGEEDDIRSFDAECLQRSVLYRPRDLEVRDAETTQHTRKVQQRANLTPVFRETVVDVGN